MPRTILYIILSAVIVAGIWHLVTLAISLSHKFVDKVTDGKFAFTDFSLFNFFNTHQRFLDTLISMLAKLAKVDGLVTAAEIRRMERIIHSDLGLSGAKARRAKRVFNDAKKSEKSFEELAEDFKFLCYHKPYLRYTMVEMLCSLAASDNAISPQEDRLIWTASRVFGLSQAQYQHIRNVYSNERKAYEHKRQTHTSAANIQNPYEVLGLKRGASESDVKKAYRKLVKETHPDRAIAKGLPEMMVESYKRRFHEIQDAYEKIREMKTF